jgi:hypothetical protein
MAAVGILLAQCFLFVRKVRRKERFRLAAELLDFGNKNYGWR